MKPFRNALALALLAAAACPAHGQSTVIGGSRLAFEGLVQMDGNWFDSDGTGPGGNDTEFELRRAEFVLRGKGPGNWSWVAGYDASADKFLDTNVQYRFNARTLLTVGQFKQPNSLEELSRTRNNDFISKAMATNLQAVGRRAGVQLAHLQPSWGITGSVFGDELTHRLAQSEGFGLRGTFAPVNETNHFLHLGLSYTDFRAEDADGNPSARFRVRPDTDLASVHPVDTGTFADADAIATTGVEAAYVKGPIKVQGEFMTSDIRRTLNPDFTGTSAYVHGVYNLTGESWGYRNGVITTGVADDPSGGMWQLGLRWETVDLDNGLVRGGSESNWTIGVNWYWRSHLRFSANYLVLDSPKGAAAQTPRALQLRAQWHW